MPFVDLAAQQRALAPELAPVIRGICERTDWILGPEVDEFEREFAAYCEADHAVGTDSGLSALELILRAAGIGRGDEVITSANTFIATVLAITHSGAAPVLVDVDPDTGSLDVEALERAISPRTRAVVAVHLYGCPAEIDEIAGVTAANGLLLVEDACQSHGARYRGRRTGSLGDAAAFSFYPGKNLGAFGDGGAVVTNDPELAEAVRVLRNYGQARKYDHVVKGFNRRLDTLQAAILRIKLRHLDDWNARRRRHAAAYADLLGDSGVSIPHAPEHVEHVWHLYVVDVPERDALRASLAELGIQTGVHYPVPIHMQKAYADLALGPGSFPVTERRAAEMMSLPMYPELEPDHIRRVADAIRRRP